MKLSLMIYFLRAVGTEFVKIGHCGSDILKRRSAIQTGCPFDLVVEATRPGNQIDENDLHEELNDKRVRGEWFRLTREEVYDLGSRPPEDPGRCPSPRSFGYDFYVITKIAEYLMLHYSGKFQEIMKNPTLKHPLSDIPEDIDFTLIDESDLADREVSWKAAHAIHKIFCRSRSSYEKHVVAPHVEEIEKWKRKKKLYDDWMRGESQSGKKIPPERLVCERIEDE